MSVNRTRWLDKLRPAGASSGGWTEGPMAPVETTDAATVDQRCPFKHQTGWRHNHSNSKLCVALRMGQANLLMMMMMICAFSRGLARPSQLSTPQTVPPDVMTNVKTTFCLRLVEVYADAEMIQKHKCAGENVTPETLGDTFAGSSKKCRLTRSRTTKKTTCRGLRKSEPVESEYSR